MLHRLCGIPNVRRGQAVGHGASIGCRQEILKGCGADRGHGDSTVCCIGVELWMLRGRRRGRGSVDGVEVEGGGKRDEVGEKRKGVPLVAMWRDMAPV